METVTTSPPTTDAPTTAEVRDVYDRLAAKLPEVVSLMVEFQRNYGRSCYSVGELKPNDRWYVSLGLWTGSAHVIGINSAATPDEAFRLALLEFNAEHEKKVEFPKWKAAQLAEEQERERFDAANVPERFETV